MAKGWSMKALHRLIMTSIVYRQSSARSAALDAADPDNRLYGRMPVRRLEAEVLRDSVLAASGRLNNKMFGPPVPVMQDDVGQIVPGIENKDGENKNGAPVPMNGEDFRRSVYVQVRRTRPLSVLEAFDAPEMSPNCEMRNSSTVAPQSLMLMNSPFVIAQANDFARRVRREATDAKTQVAAAWRLAFGREATDDQLKQAMTFIDDQLAELKAHPPAPPPPAPAAKNAAKTLPPQESFDPNLAAMTSFCQALLSANGFLYVD